MDAVWSQGALLFGKKVSQNVVGHPAGEVGSRPHDPARPQSAGGRDAVYRLVVGTDDVERDVPLEFPQGQR